MKNTANRQILSHQLRAGNKAPRNTGWQIMPRINNLPCISAVQSNIISHGNSIKSIDYICRKTSKCCGHSDAYILAICKAFSWAQRKVRWCKGRIVDWLLADSCIQVAAIGALFLIWLGIPEVVIFTAVKVVQA